MEKIEYVVQYLPEITFFASDRWWDVYTSSDQDEAKRVLGARRYGEYGTKLRYRLVERTTITEETVLDE